MRCARRWRWVPPAPCTCGRRRSRAPTSAPRSRSSRRPCGKLDVRPGVRGRGHVRRAGRRGRRRGRGPAGPAVPVVRVGDRAAPTARVRIHRISADRLRRPGGAARRPWSWARSCWASRATRRCAASWARVQGDRRLVAGRPGHRRRLGRGGGRDDTGRSAPSSRRSVAARRSCASRRTTRSPRWSTSSPPRRLI